MANNNNTKNLNVPNLRFPEFKGEWKKYKVSDILEFFPTNSLSWDQLEYGTDNIYNLHYGLIHKGLPTQIELVKCSLPNIKKELIPKNYTLCKDGDVAFADASEDTNDVGKVVEFLSCENKNIICGLHTIHGRDKKNLTINGFKGYAFSSEIFRCQIRRLSQGTKIYSISPKNFKDISIGVPSKEEQSKIAALLWLLDHRIATQNKIIEKYESLIKGIGNKLFSFKMRFKTNDGNDFPSWKTKSFENIGKTFSGLSGKAKEDFGIGKPYIQYKQVFDSPQIQIQNCGLVNVSDSENQNNVKYGDVFFTVSSETPDEIGMSSVLLDEVDEMYLNSFCFGYRLSSFEVLSPLYASYFFRDSSFRNKVVKIAQGSTRYNISKSELIKLEISLPSIEEQARIASFLSAVDEKIKNEKEILNLYLIQKSYLLRQMFI